MVYAISRYAMMRIQSLTWNLKMIIKNGCPLPFRSISCFYGEFSGVKFSHQDKILDAEGHCWMSVGTVFDVI